MDQATVIVGVQKIADVQRDHYNRSRTLISAAGAHAFCPNFVYASMLINGYTSETYNICERRVYRTKKPRRRALVLPFRSYGSSPSQFSDGIIPVN